jgi:hypothetical protein
MGAISGVLGSKGTCIYPHIETANPKPYIYTHTYTHTHTHTHTHVAGCECCGKPSHEQTWRDEMYELNYLRP